MHAVDCYIAYIYVCVCDFGGIGPRALRAPVLLWVIWEAADQPSLWRAQRSDILGASFA